MSFHNYEKKVNRKTNKIRQVIDDQKKYKMQRKETLKKNRFKNEGKEKQKPTFSMKKHDSRQFLLIFGRNFPQQRQENATYSLITWLHNIYRKTKRLKAKVVSCKKNVTQAVQPSQVVSLTILLKCCGHKNPTSTILIMSLGCL